MQLLAQEEYGLRCLAQVARHRGPQPLTIQSIAEREGLSPEYTAKLMRALRQGGLVESTRGAGGGYRLARPPEQITVWDAIRGLGGSFYSEGFCDSHPGQKRDCVHTPNCSIRSLWRAVESAVREVMEGITLSDLNRDERETLLWIDAPASAQEDGAP